MWVGVVIRADDVVIILLATSSRRCTEQSYQKKTDAPANDTRSKSKYRNRRTDRQTDRFVQDVGGVCI